MEVIDKVYKRTMAGHGKSLFKIETVQEKGLKKIIEFHRDYTKQDS